MYPMNKAKAAVSRKGTAAKPVKSGPRKISHPIQLYYWPTPNGHKISIALEEMKLAYVIKPVNIGKGEQFAPAFLKISPNNRMPAIIDPNGPGGRPVSIFESGAILQYLGRKTGKFYPKVERARVEVEEWLFWQVGGWGPWRDRPTIFSIMPRKT
jgi:glutathione S-transferase